MKTKNILAENMLRFGTKNLSKNILKESNLSDDDILDIILTYTKDPDEAEEQLSVYRETGKFSDNALEANVTRDPRWKLSNDVAGTDSGAGNRSIQDIF
jgi:hypothetical protein